MQISAQISLYPLKQPRLSPAIEDGLDDPGRESAGPEKRGDEHRGQRRGGKGFWGNQGGFSKGGGIRACFHGGDLFQRLSDLANRGFIRPIGS